MDVELPGLHRALSSSHAESATSWQQIGANLAAQEARSIQSLLQLLLPAQPNMDASSREASDVLHDARGPAHATSNPSVSQLPAGLDHSIPTPSFSVPSPVRQQTVLSLEGVVQDQSQPPDATPSRTPTHQEVLDDLTRAHDGLATRPGYRAILASGDGQEAPGPSGAVPDPAAGQTPGTPRGGAPSL